MKTSLQLRQSTIERFRNIINLYEQPPKDIGKTILFKTIVEQYYKGAYSRVDYVEEQEILKLVRDDGDMIEAKMKIDDFLKR